MGDALGPKGNGRLSMVRLTPVVRWWPWFRVWLLELKDVIPPYILDDGPIEGKETDSTGKFYILVRAARIEVDRATFDILAIGESIRVRYTRGKRAISIDRLVRGNGGV